MITTTLLTIMQLLLSFGNLCILGYALFKFLNKPHDTLEAKVIALEAEIIALKAELKEIMNSLHSGNDRFRKQDDTNEMFISCMLAFIDFEIAYCHHTNYEHSEDLEKAKTILQHYLAKR